MPAAIGCPRRCLLVLRCSVSGVIPTWHVINCWRNIHSWSCHGCTAHSRCMAAVRVPTSISCTMKLLLSAVPNGDCLVGTWYIHSRYVRQEINFPPTSPRSISILLGLSTGMRDGQTFLGLTTRMRDGQWNGKYIVHRHGGVHGTSGRCPFHMIKFLPGRSCRECEGYPCLMHLLRRYQVPAGYFKDQEVVEWICVW